MLKSGYRFRKNLYIYIYVYFNFFPKKVYILNAKKNGYIFLSKGKS